MSLQVKIIILVCAITILCGVGSALLAGRILHQIMEMHLISTATSICQALGENISENVYNGEAVKARITLQEVADKIEGMEYAYIIDFDGRLFAHTFEGSFPEDLVTAEHHTLVRADEPLVTRFMASGVPVIDVAYPIVDGMTGHIHIGISETGMHSRIADLRNQILGFTLLIMLIGAGFGTILSLRITRPIRRLADAIKDFGKGSNELKADFSSGGMEVVSLSESFYEMISERELAEQALRKSEKSHKDLLNDLVTFIGVLDSSGNILFANNTPLKVAGIELEEVIGKKFYDAFWFEYSEEARQTIKRDIEQCALGKTIVRDIEHKTTDGSLIWVEFSMHPIFDEDGRVTYLIPEGRDITDRKELEEKLRHAEKLEAIGQLAGGIAHDFNNIMTGIFGYCDLLEGELVRKSRASEYVREITDAAERAADLTSKLLAFSRKQVIEAIDLNINDAIEKAVGLLKRVLGEHIELDVIPGHNLGTVFADPSHISQIIMNLAVNARDAMPEGGKLTIETENVAINGAYAETHPWAKPGRYVLLSVADTGCGIPPDVLAHVFEPFFTTKDVDKGTGLGLATVYGLIKQHEGMVNIYSEVGKGTTVKIYLPIVERKASEIETKIEKKIKGGDETILLVEDDDTVRQMTARLLENAGYSVITATNGIEAVNIFKKKGDSIDLVLTDMMMPKMSGDEVCEKVRNIRENIKCIISSGYSIQSLPSSLKGQSGIPILTKPFSPDALLRTVREVLDTGEGESAQN